MDKSHRSIYILAALLLIALVSHILYSSILWHFIPQAQDRGLFGDMFGAMNALFSGLAFAGIIYTILMQRSEFSMNVSTSERTVRISAISSLLTAYTERVRYLDSRASPQGNKVIELQSKIEKIITQLEDELSNIAIIPNERKRNE